VRVLLATGDRSLDQFVRDRFADQVAGEVYYREAVRESYLRFSADTLFLASGLAGAMDVRDVVFGARMDGLRCVCLLSEADKARGLGHDLMAMGVYDLLFSPVNAEDIAARLRSPASFSDAAGTLRLQSAPKSGPLQALLGKLEETKDSVRKTVENGKRKTEAKPETEVRRPGKESSDESERVTGAPSLEGFRPNRPLIPVWSPVPAGKTFVAVNLAWVYSKSMSAVLLDLDPKQATREWLCLRDGEDTLVRALDAEGDLPEPARVGDLRVFCYDPSAWKIEIKPKALARLLSSGSESSPIVIDLPSRLGDLEDSIIDAAGICVLVGDPDWSRRAAVRRAGEWLTERGVWVVPVLNRYADVSVVPGWKPEAILTTKPAAVIQARPGDAYAAIASGNPGASFVKEWETAFAQLAVRSMMLARKTRSADTS
jgi:Mrp family chromosome partitioning ATPase